MQMPVRRRAVVCNYAASGRGCSFTERTITGTGGGAVVRCRRWVGCHRHRCGNFVGRVAHGRAQVNQGAGRDHSHQRQNEDVLDQAAAQIIPWPLFPPLRPGRRFTTPSPSDRTYRRCLITDRIGIPAREPAPCAAPYEFVLFTLLAT